MNKINMQIQYLKVDSLNAYDNNSRKHSESQIKRIEASITEFGFTNPILINKDLIILAGHGRVEAAKNLGIKEVPTLCLEYLSKKQQRAYIIADNKLAELSYWDEDILKMELEDLYNNDFDLAILGFDTFDFGNEETTSKAEKNKKELIYKETLQVIVECSSEMEQEKVYNMLSQEGYQCKILSM